MNSEIKQLWIDALRSGEYKQGVGVLHGRSNSFCCLGVLCDVVAKNGLAELEVERQRVDGVVLYNGHSASLPVAVSTLADIGEFGELSEPIEGRPYAEQPDPRFDESCEESESYDSLSILNDFVGLDFDQIADIIENMF